MKNLVYFALWMSLALGAFSHVATAEETSKEEIISAEFEGEKAKSYLKDLQQSSLDSDINVEMIEVQLMHSLLIIANRAILEDTPLDHFLSTIDGIKISVRTIDMSSDENGTFCTYDIGLDNSDYGDYEHNERIFTSPCHQLVQYINDLKPKK